MLVHTPRCSYVLTDYSGGLKTNICSHYNIWRPWLDLMSLCLMFSVSMSKEFPVSIQMVLPASCTWAQSWVGRYRPTWLGIFSVLF